MKLVVGCDVVEGSFVEAGNLVVGTRCFEVGKDCFVVGMDLIVVDMDYFVVGMDCFVEGSLAEVDNLVVVDNLVEEGSSVAVGSQGFLLVEVFQMEACCCSRVRMVEGSHRLDWGTFSEKLSKNSLKTERFYKFKFS